MQTTLSPFFILLKIQIHSRNIKKIRIFRRLLSKDYIISQPVLAWNLLIVYKLCAPPFPPNLIGMMGIRIFVVPPSFQPFSVDIIVQ